MRRLFPNVLFGFCLLLRNPLLRATKLRNRVFGTIICYARVHHYLCSVVMLDNVFGLTDEGQVVLHFLLLRQSLRKLLSLLCFYICFCDYTFSITLAFVCMIVGALFHSFLPSPASVRRYCIIHFQVLLHLLCVNMCCVCVCYFNVCLCVCTRVCNYCPFPPHPLNCTLCSCAPSLSHGTHSTNPLSPFTAVSYFKDNFSPCFLSHESSSCFLNSWTQEFMEYPRWKMFVLLQ